jgi:DNA-binding MarR family transcriptional regulator
LEKKRVGTAESHHPQLGVYLRLLHQQWTQAVEEALEAAGFGDIRPPHANVFTFVPSHGIQVSELTRLARVRKQSMAQAVEELERLGYVERRPDPSDRRARLVFLTPRGQRVRPLAMSAGRQVGDHWSSLIGADRLQAITGQLRDLLNALQIDTSRNPDSHPQP